MRNAPKKFLEFLKSDNKDANFIKSAKIKFIKKVYVENDKENVLQEFFFRVDGLIEKEIYSYNDTIFQVVNYKYDNNKNLIRKEFEKDFGWVEFSKRKAPCYNEYIYDGANKLIEIREYSKDGTFFQINYKYDKMGNLIEERNSYYIKEYEWYGDKLTKILEFKKNQNNVFDLVYLEKNIYNTKGQLLNCFRNSQKVEYVYDENNKLSKEIYTDIGLRNRLHIKSDTTKYKRQYFKDYYTIEKIDNGKIEEYKKLNYSDSLLYSLYYRENKVANRNEFLYDNSKLVKKISSDYLTNEIDCVYYDRSGNILKRLEYYKPNEEEFFNSKIEGEVEFKYSSINLGSGLAPRLDVYIPKGRNGSYYFYRYNSNGLLTEECFDRRGERKLVYHYEYYQ